MLIALRIPGYDWSHPLTELVENLGGVLVERGGAISVHQQSRVYVDSSIVGSSGSSDGDVDGSGTCGSLDGMKTGSGVVSPVESSGLVDGVSDGIDDSRGVSDGVEDSRGVLDGVNDSRDVSCGVSDGAHKVSDVSPGRDHDGVKEGSAVSDGSKEGFRGHCGGKHGVEDGTPISGGQLGTRDGSATCAQRDAPVGTPESVDGVLEPSASPATEPSAPTAILVNDGVDIGAKKSRLVHHPLQSKWRILEVCWWKGEVQSLCTSNLKSTSTALLWGRVDHPMVMSMARALVVR